MITKEQLQAMSDFERNKLLATLSGETVGDEQQQKFAELDVNSVVIVRDGVIDVIDYCNTPNDIMPLAFEYEVGVMPMVGRWKALKLGSFGFNVEFENVKPLLAIACCLILVLQEKQK